MLQNLAIILLKNRIEYIFNKETLKKSGLRRRHAPPRAARRVRCADAKKMCYDSSAGGYNENL